jgi:predicted dehydrogenase
MTHVRQGALVGFGNVAAYGHLPGWCARSDFRIGAVADPDPQRRAAAAAALAGVRTYAAIEELLAAEQLAFVDVASPPAFHAAAVIGAAAHGLHVLCEKPLTTRLSDYLRMRTAVGAAGTVLHTVHNWKHSDGFRAARRWLAEGAIGALRRVSFEVLRNGCAATTAANWRIDPSVGGGGILVDHGWHTFYLLTSLVGERPCRIRATVERARFANVAVEDTARCVVDFPTCVAEIHLTWAASRRCTRWEFEGSRGALRIEDDRLILESPRLHHEERLGSALSAGSHHPEWFAGVLDEFAREIDAPSARGANLMEAELCVLMLSLAYESSADDSRPRDIPAHMPWPEEAAPCREHRDHPTADGG